MHGETLKFVLLPSSEGHTPEHGLLKSLFLSPSKRL